MLDSYTFIKPETGQEERVKPERWCWEAHYTDGSILKQFNDEDRTFHQIREIDQQKMKVFRMINYDKNQFYDVDWHPSRKLIHLYQRHVLENETLRVTLYAFGYVTYFNGASHNVIMVILPNDSVVITENLDNIKLSA